MNGVAIMFEWIPGDSINCIYFALVAVGLVYTVISLIGADFGGADVGGADIDFHIGGFDVAGVEIPEVDLGVDSPEIDIGGASLQLPSISPFAIASFVTGFGAAGIVANLAFEVSALASLLWAALGGFVLGGATQLFFGVFLLRSQGSSEVRVAGLAGTIAEVTIPIPAESSGQIAFVYQGRRVTYSARSADKEAIARGAQVQILRVVGGTAVVRPATDE
jgi:membrane protein implicated in regulation of membrane protease activity